jgi:DNA-binding MarR family transcriptional regulator
VSARILFLGAPVFEDTFQIFALTYYLFIAIVVFINYITGEVTVESKVIGQFRAKLREIERAVWQQTKSEALCCGVTMPQCHAILEIGNAGELNLKELAARLGLDNSTLSRTVESLVQDGLADRTASKEDRRATVIRLNKKGRVALDRINSTWNRICRDMFLGIPREKHEQLIESVSIVADLLTGCCRGPCSTGESGDKRNSECRRASK